MEHKIRAMNESDINFALSITSKEGWLYTAGDLERMIRWQPDGCFVLEVEGKPSGMATSIDYGDFGWVGNVVVERDSRGNELGRAIMDHCEKTILGRGAKAVALFAYEDTGDFYTRLGYTLVARIASMFRRPRDPGQEPAPRQTTQEPEVLEAALATDREAFGGDRHRVLTELHAANTGLFGFTLEPDGGLSSYLFGKAFGRNFEIGPWYRSTRDTGPALNALDDVLVCMNSKVFLGVPEINTDIISALKERGFIFVEYVHMMVKGEPPGMDLERMCAVGALEKG